MDERMLKGAAMIESFVESNLCFATAYPSIAEPMTIQTEAMVFGARVILGQLEDGIQLDEKLETRWKTEWKPAFDKLLNQK